MKAKALVFALFFLCNHISAQFYTKIELDTFGVYTVSLKSEQALGSRLSIPSARIGITAPFGGFEIGEITSLHGEWSSYLHKITLEDEPAIPHDYFFVRLLDSKTLERIQLEEGEEIGLFTFKNVGKCTGDIALIQADDPLVTKENPAIITTYAAITELPAYDNSTGISHEVVGNYDIGQANCDSVKLHVPPIVDSKERVFSLKLDKVEDRFVVSVQSTIDITHILVGSVQVSITSPKFGLEITDFQTKLNMGVWNYFFWDRSQNFLETDYLYFGLGTSFELRDIKAGGSIELFSFKNAAECTGPIQLLKPDDPIAELNYINSEHDFSVLDMQTFDTYHFLETYGVDAIGCQDTLDNGGIDTLDNGGIDTLDNGGIDTLDNGGIDTLASDSIFIMIDQTAARSADIEWPTVENAQYYQLEVRPKGTANWESAQRISTKKNKIYFYGPLHQIFEGRVTTYYLDKTKSISNVFEFELLQED